MPFIPTERNFPPQDKLVVTAMGPIGHVYLPKILTDKEKEIFAKRMVHDAKIPLVLTPSRIGKVTAWNEYGSYTLPEDAKEVFGADHPFLKEVARDIVLSCSSVNAGTFTISGWKPNGPEWSFPNESGSHGGPGQRETQGFVLLPSDIFSPSQKKKFIRPSDLRNAALKFMKKEFAVFKTGEISTVDKEKQTIRVMTYNVHGCKGADSKISPERIARVIARHNPDIVALQELDMNRLRSGVIDQPHVIANELGMYFHFHPCIEVEEQQYGNAVLSKYPLRLMCAKRLPGLKKQKDREPRGAIWVSADIDGTAFHVVNTHLGLNREERLNQIDALLGREWMDNPDCAGPMILIGDFNALPNSEGCKRVKKRLRDIQEGLPNHRPKATWAGRFPMARIDHIFLGPGINVEHVKISETRLDRVASDHLPLIADLKVRT